MLNKSTYTFPFQLTSITISLTASCFPPSFLSSILQPTITSASFIFLCLPPNEEESRLQAIEARAPQFRDVSLKYMEYAERSFNRHLGDSSLSRERLKLFWGSFTSVKKLTCCLTDVEYITSLGSRFHELRIDDVDFSCPVGDWLPRLEEAVQSVLTLRRLEMNFDVDRMTGCGGFNGDLAKICSRKGIELVWVGSFEYGSLWSAFFFHFPRRT